MLGWIAQQFEKDHLRNWLNFLFSLTVVMDVIGVLAYEPEVWELVHGSKMHLRLRFMMSHIVALGMLRLLNTALRQCKISLVLLDGGRCQVYDFFYHIHHISTCISILLPFSAWSGNILSLFLSICSREGTKIFPSVSARYFPSEMRS